MTEHQKENKEDQTPDIKPRKYTASVSSSDEPLPDDFVRGIKQIEAELDTPIWLIIQNETDGILGELNYELYKEVFHCRDQIDENKPIALLIDTPGGNPKFTYQLAKFFVHHCGGYTALIPSYAKSAGTLLALGASKIILGRHAELGPLDLQILDPEGEKRISALDHVQSLEQLRSFALQTLDTAVYMLLARTGKKINTILPQAINFSTALVRPLFEDIDVVRYTEMSRNLKIGEDYAIRLLTPKYGDIKARDIAKTLTSEYSEHSFDIDQDEAKKIGIKVDLPEGNLSEAYTTIIPYMDKLSVIGRLIEFDENEKK